MNIEFINRAELLGVVGADPKITNVGDTQVVRFALATNLCYQTTNGTSVCETSWHNISAWRGDGITDFKNIKKGAVLSVIGRIKYSRYTDQNGNERLSTEIIANKVKPYIPNEDKK